MTTFSFSCSTLSNVCDFLVSTITTRIYINISLLLLSLLLPLSNYYNLVLISHNILIFINMYNKAKLVGREYSCHSHENSKRDNTFFLL